MPTAIPKPATVHSDAAVVNPVTLCFVTMMVPAPKKPIPLTTCAINLAWSERMTPVKAGLANASFNALIAICD